MHNIIAKFGGTSVKTAAAIKQIAKIVKNESQLRVIVVSAVGGVTDLLVAFCHADAKGRSKLIKQITDIHLDLSKELKISATDEIRAKLTRLHGLDSSTKLTKAQIDHILSLGEDLSSLIVHGFLESSGIVINKVDARDYIVTDDHFCRAVPDIKAIEERVQFIPHGLCIMQGFIGSTKDGRTTTLGRGGSDYTAALIAEAIKAKEVLIYTDVPGVYTMDPNITASARVIEELSFQEMEEMASFGAKVLFPATLEPCMRAKINIRILSTFEPGKAGTYIRTIKTDKHVPKVRAVTMRRNQVLVTIKSLKMLNAYGFLANIFSVLAKYKISIDLITTSEVSVALTVDRAGFGSHGLNPFVAETDLLHELKQFAEISIEEQLSLVAVIGSSLTIPGTVQDILGAIGSSTIRLICYGASKSNVGILVKEKEAITIAKKLHDELLEK